MGNRLWGFRSPAPLRRERHSCRRCGGRYESEETDANLRPRVPVKWLDRLLASLQERSWHSSQAVGVDSGPGLSQGIIRIEGTSA